MRCPMIIRCLVLCVLCLSLNAILPAGDCTGFYLGDVDGDCSVGLGDLVVLAQYWIDASPCSDYACGDLDESGTVDIADYAVVADQWQQSVSVVITEFLASNDDEINGLKDEDGSNSDWIELRNYASYPVSLNGWYLTDDKKNLDKWQFPDVTLNSGQYRIVFASGKDRTDPSSPLHTNFYLGITGEYLALVAPDGKTVVSEYRDVPAQYEDVSYGLAVRTNEYLLTGNYFLSPTPLTANSGPYNNLGPAISNVTHTPLRPMDAEDLMVTATIVETQKPVSSVRLYYRTHYGSEFSVPMFDDGAHNDGLAADGVYGALIPASAATSGQMLRYYVKAVDISGGENRLPLPLDLSGNNQSPEYFGTVIANPSVTSNLPIFEWFTYNASASHTRTGTRASVYYQDRFYDNIFVRQRGGYTNAASQKFNFNKGYGFYINDELDKLGEINLNAQGADPAFIRQSLAFEVHRLCGVPASESFLTLMQVNGGFDRVGILIEQVDEDLLKRYDLDPEGALYKFVQRVNLDPVFNDTITGIEKKTRQWEDLSDLQSVVDGLNAPTETERKNFVFDNLNLPAIMNYLSARCLTQDTDDVRKNFYFYRDTNGTGEWLLLPWDKDYSFGVIGDGGTYYNHPLFGDYAHRKNNANQWNVLYEVLFNMPETREMYLRRLRSLMDQWLQPPGTPTDQLFFFEARCDEVAAPAMPHIGISSYINSMKNYFPGRRNDLYVTYGPSGSEPLIPESLAGSTELVVTDTLISGVPGITTAQYHIPSDGSLGLTWTENDFSGSWSTGYTGIGYERSPGDAVNYSDLIATDINSQMSGRKSCYIRIPFTISSPDDYDSLVLSMKYDDGFVAYINGTEVTRRYFSGTPAWNSGAAGGRSDSACKVFEEIIISDSALVAGENILAIHALNNGSTSSDLLILPELKGAVNTIVNPVVLDVDINNVEFNPASSIQDQEYIEIVNNSGVAVDLSGWHLSSAVDFTFAPGTVLISGGSVYVSPAAQSFRQRAVSPTGGEARFVVGPYKGHFSNWGETIVLTDTNQTVIDTFTYLPAPSDPQRYLRITEIMYHPAQGGSFNEEEYEYIELKNIGSESLLLDGVKFSSGITYAFNPGTSIPAGQYRLLVKNQAAFESRYPGLSGLILGQYVGSLDNGGERIDLLDATNSTILDFAYKDGWYDITDGDGFSLTIKDTSDPDLTQWDQKAGWRPSAAIGGSPGTDDTGTIPAIGSVVINEILAHSDTIAYDWIELHNTMTQPINIGGWFLSDDNTDDTSRKKYEIASGTSIPAGGYVVFYENVHFGNPSDPGCMVPFQLSENGETLYLQSGQSGVLTGYFEEESFGASDKDIAFGRYQKSTGAFNFVAMSSNTPGSANAAPKVGPIVITEIMYHPQANDDAEYVELKNISGSSVTLYDFTTNEPWRFVDDTVDPGIEFIFPTTPVTVAAGQTILLIKNAVAFKAEYGANSLDGVTWYEWLDGSLSNSGEKPELQMPGDINAVGERQYIRIDRVSYDDTAPWPTEPDGGGQSLTKPVAKESLYGNDVANWQAAEPSPGT